jgi:hypothetical protein
MKFSRKRGRKKWKRVRERSKEGRTSTIPFTSEEIGLIR